MGSYYNPPDTVRDIGRELSPGSFTALAAQLNGDEVLFGFYDRGPFKNAVHLFSSDEMEEFEVQARARIIKRLGYYAVRREDAEIVCGPIREQHFS